MSVSLCESSHTWWQTQRELPPNNAVHLRYLVVLVLWPKTLPFYFHLIPLNAICKAPNDRQSQWLAGEWRFSCLRPRNFSWLETNKKQLYNLKSSVIYSGTNCNLFCLKMTVQKNESNLSVHLWVALSVSFSTTLAQTKMSQQLLDIWYIHSWTLEDDYQWLWWYLDLLTPPTGKSIQLSSKFC